MKTVILNRFDPGISNDPRADGNVCRMVSNFDAFTNPKKLIPYADSESGDSSASTRQLQNFVVAYTGSVYKLFGLGVVSGTAKAQVYAKTLTTGGSGDLSDALWDNFVTNGASSTGSTSFNLFTYYRKTGLIYGAKSGNRIWAFSPSGAAFDENIIGSNGYTPFSYTNIAEGLVHSKANILYIPYDNFIAKCDATSGSPVWNTTALTLPDNLYITAICEQGNNLAIMAAPLNGVGRSRVFIWDRDATAVNIDESIDWGDGVGKVLYELDGVLIGITLSGNNSTRNKNRIVFRYYDGYIGKPFLTLEDEGTVTQLLSAKQLTDNRLWFAMALTKNGSCRAGAWSIGRTEQGWSLYHERTVNNDTAFATSDSLVSFIKIGDYLFQSVVVSSANALYKTNDQASYTATSGYESKVNPGMDPGDLAKLKKLVGIAVMTEKLTGSAQVVVKVKTDGGSFVTALTHSTSTKNSRGKTDLIVAEKVGDQIADFRELEVRLESTGGAVITGAAYAYDTYKSTIFA